MDTTAPAHIPAAAAASSHGSTDRIQGNELDALGDVLRDAAAVHHARRRLSALGAQLAAEPFDETTRESLREFLGDPATKADVARARLVALTEKRPS